MNPKAYALYHYTKKFDTLKLILKGGFWPRYSPEDFTWITANGSPLYLVVPMVCFCDIPIELCRDHRNFYGNYVIGLKKDWGKKAGLTPVHYVYEDGPVANHLRKTFSRPITKTPLQKIDFGAVWQVLPYLKPVTGAFPDKGLDHHSTGRKDFDEEMEWRFVPEAHRDSIYTNEWLDSVADWNHANDESNKTFNDKLRFNKSDIEIVVVKTPLQRKKIIALEPSLRGRVKLLRELRVFRRR